MDEPRVYYIEWSESEREKDTVTLTHIYGVWKDGTDGPICRAAAETQT